MDLNKMMTSGSRETSAGCLLFNRRQYSRPQNITSPATITLFSSVSSE